MEYLKSWSQMGMGYILPCFFLGMNIQHYPTIPIPAAEQKGTMVLTHTPYLNFGPTKKWAGVVKCSILGILDITL